MKGSFTKTKILSSFTHLHGIPNLYNFLSSVFVHAVKVNGVQFLCMDKINLNTFFKTSNFVYWFGMK